MTSYRRRALAALAATLLLVIPTAPVGAGERADYVVVAELGASSSSVKAAVRAAGGRVTAEHAAIGIYSANGPATGFILAVSASPAVDSATSARPIGAVAGAAPVKGAAQEAGAIAAAATSPTERKPGGGSTAGLDPLDGDQWGLEMVRSGLAREVNAGDRRVLVGIMDTGIDATHPDLAPNFSFALSRNFAPDIPDIDGPCEVASCLDPIGRDDNGHGTHVAGIVGAAANGLGISGVAPGVTLVQLKVGQDGGFFFLEPVVSGLEYAADNGIDVVNMSFFVDPWLYNCQDNPADSPEHQLEQRAIVTAMTRALDYANSRNVTLVGSMGNSHVDLGDPGTDVISPDYPIGAEYPRTIDNATCLDLPIEGPHVIGVSGLGPSEAKADYSNYGLEQISVSAPGGWFRDFFGEDEHRTFENLILSTYPLAVLQEEGLVDPAGNVTSADVVKDCNDEDVCGYYTYLQGASMAAPHATGVAALIVSRFGIKDNKLGGLRLAPHKTEFVLVETAAEHACPDPPLVSYANEGRPADWDALCQGTTEFNGFYGAGIVDAYAAVTMKLELPD